MSEDVARPMSTIDTDLQTMARLSVLANASSPEELFEAIAHGLAQVSTPGGADRPVNACVFRFTGSGSVTALGASNPAHPMVPPHGTQWELDGDSANAALWKSGEVSRVDGPLVPNGTISSRRDRAGVTSVVAGPVVVEGRLWGSVTVFSDLDEPLPPETESRVTAFAELAGAAVTSAERTRRLRRLLDEQAARRELAVMIADGAEAQTLFDAVTAAAGRHCRAFGAGLVRFDGETTSTVVAMWSPGGSTGDVPLAWPRAEDTMGGRVREVGSTARVDDWRMVSGPNARAMHEHFGIGGSVAAPVLVEGRLWGLVMVHSRLGHALPEGTEPLLLGFAELVASAVASAARRSDTRRLAEEQAALRRIATLVASEAPPTDVYRMLLDEIGSFPGVDDARVVRLSDDRQHGEVVAAWGVMQTEVPVGFVTPLERTMALGSVLTSGKVVKVENVRAWSGEFPTLAERHGLVEAVGCPILIGDQLWGALTVSSRTHGGLSEATVSSLVQGAGLIATAVANAQARESVRASRERLVTVGDAARRRIERDLHDGAQQRLVALTMELRSRSPDHRVDPEAVAAEIDEVVAEIRTISRGIHPAVLDQGGLRPALRNLVRRSAVPTRLIVPAELPTLGEAVEVALFYVVSEALTNVARHSGANEATVTVDVAGHPRQVTVGVVDNGVGGAEPRSGGGLQGLGDRVEALGGTLSLSSASGAGTVLHVRLPVRDLPGRDLPGRSAGSVG